MEQGKKINNGKKNEEYEGMTMDISIFRTARSS